MKAKFSLSGVVEGAQTWEATFEFSDKALLKNAILHSQRTREGLKHWLLRTSDGSCDTKNRYLNFVLRSTPKGFRRNFEIKKQWHEATMITK